MLVLLYDVQQQNFNMKFDQPTKSSGGGGGGTVTSVGISLPSIFTVTGSPVTTAGTITAVFTSQTQNLVFASPNGSSGLPSFRNLVTNDLPAGIVTNVSVATANGFSGSSSGGSTPILTLNTTLTSSGNPNSNNSIPYINGGTGALSFDIGGFAYDPINHTVFINQANLNSPNGQTFFEVFGNSDVTEASDSGATVAYPIQSVSTYRGVYATPSVTQANDIVGQFTYYAVTTGPTFVQFASMQTQAIGATAGNVGGQWTLGTKANGGSLTTAITVSNTQTVQFNSGYGIGVLHSSSVGLLSSSLIVAADITTNTISNTNLRQGVARSVIGVTGNATANVADIQGTANQVLVVNSGGTALAFGQVNLASASAVTGITAVTNGGTGQNTLTSNALLCGAGSSGINAVATVGTNGQLLLGQTASRPTWNTMGGDAIITNSGTLTINNAAIIYAKIQNGAASRLLGNPTGVPAAPSEITLGTGLSFAGTTLNIATSAAPTSVGAFGGSLANGMTISGNVLTLGAADTTNPGGVSTTTQTFTGAKAFATAGTVFNGTNAGIAAVLINSQAGTTSGGGLWNDSTQIAYGISPGSPLLKEFIVGAMFTQTASGTVTNSTSTTSMTAGGIGTLTLPANFLVAGKTIRFKISGSFGTKAITPGNVTVAFKIGAVIFTFPTISTIIAGGSNDAWDSEVLLTCRTTGVSGTLVINGKVFFDTVVGATQGITSSATNPSSLPTLDTTISNALDFTWAFATADPANTASGTIATIEVLN